jgi:hypothetical protein
MKKQPEFPGGTRVEYLPNGPLSLVSLQSGGVRHFRWSVLLWHTEAGPVQAKDILKNLRS